METRRVILFGNSVILGTIGSSLRQRPQFEVTTLAPPFPAVEELAGMAPDIVLFDLHGTRPEAAFALLESCPSLLLVGVSSERNEVTIWSGQHLTELSTQELVQTIAHKMT